MTIDDGNENLPVVGADQQLVERSLDIQAALSSVDAVGDTLRPHYDIIRSQLLGHAGLYGVAQRENRRDQAEADLELLTGFGNLLPPVHVTRDWRAEGYNDDDYWMWSYGGKQEVSVVVPDLYQAKLVQSLGLVCRKIYRTLPITMGYIVGERPQNDGNTNVLIVSPPLTTAYRKGEDAPDEEPSKVWMATVPTPALHAYHRYSDKLLTSSFTNSQVNAMRVYGHGGYKVGTETMPLVDLHPEGAKTDSEADIAKNGLGTSSYWYRNHKLSPVKTSHYTVAKQVLVSSLEAGIGEWESERFLLNLAEAFGQRDELKQLLVKRQQTILPVTAAEQ